MDFITISRNILEKRLQVLIEERICPDQYVGKIMEFSEQFPIRSSVGDRPSKTKCLIMLLESPHKEEFKKVVSPAKGTTGKLILKHILVVKELSKFSDYGLILMNAVQNQCSLGYSTGCYRDEVFISLWNNGAKENFIERLKGVYRQGDVIVNCCTKGKDPKQELRKLVQLSIPKDLGQILRRTHPSSWYSAKNRKFEWEMT